MFSNRLNRVENVLQRGVTGFFKQSILNFRGEESETFAFRPLGRSAFQIGANPQMQPEPPTKPAPIHAAPLLQPKDRGSPLPRVSPLPVARPLPAVKPTPVPPIAARAPMAMNPASKAMADDMPLSQRMTSMQWIGRQQKFVARLNSTLPAGCHLAAYNIIPTELFTGELGRFLMLGCDFYSHCFANTILLPTMAAGVAHFNLPQHPKTRNEMQFTDANTRLLQLRRRVASEHSRVATAIGRGDVSQIFKSDVKRIDSRQELANICYSIAINAIGPAAFNVHENLFGADLSGQNS